MEYIGRQGQIHWYPTNEWYPARIVDYDAARGVHKVVWYDEWRYSELILGGISNAEEGVHGFRPGRASVHPRHLAGKRIILQPSDAHILTAAGNAEASTDYRACVLTRAKDFSTGRGNSFYHVFYQQHQLIVTANLAEVRYEVIDNVTDVAQEVRNPDMMAVQLDEPLLMSPLDD